MQTREYIERVDNFNQQNIESLTANDHYMYLMPDDFILDAVINPFSWTEEESRIAKKILKLRNLSPWHK